MYATDDSAGGTDELDAITEGGDYGSPAGRSGTIDPVVTYPDAQGGPGGCAAADSTVFIGLLEGQKISIAAFDGQGHRTTAPQAFLADKYGRLRTVVLDAQGGLWITTSNRDGLGTPAADDDKVLRIVPPTSSGHSPL
jgi:streptogramin lyase